MSMQSEFRKRLRDEGWSIEDAERGAELLGEVFGFTLLKGAGFSVQQLTFHNQHKHYDPKAYAKGAMEAFNYMEASMMGTAWFQEKENWKERMDILWTAAGGYPPKYQEDEEDWDAEDSEEVWLKGKPYEEEEDWDAVSADEEGEEDDQDWDAV